MKPSDNTNRRLFYLLPWLLMLAAGAVSIHALLPSTQYHATVAAMTSAPAPALDGSIHQTAGYTTAGVGAGTYIYHRTGRPTADGGFYHNGPLADDYYELIDKREANSLQFGATCDTGNTDDLARLQACVDAGILHDVQIHFQSRQNGDYDISEPLFATGTASKTSVGSFYTAEIYGDGSSNGALTTIAPTFTNRPGVCIQAARGVVIKDIAIGGTNDAPFSVAATGQGTYANWIDGDHRDSRYSPQCAIAIDPTVGTEPADPYPSMTYIGNTTVGSNRIKLIRLRIYKHVVGVIVRPDGQSNQCDDITLSDCMIDRVALCYAVCNTQSRPSMSVENLQAENFHTIIDTLRYGAQTGVPPNVSGLQAVTGFRFMRIGHTHWSTKWEDVYAEGLREIGILGTGSSTTKATASLVNWNVSFNHGNSSRSPFMFSAFMPVTIIGSTFKTTGDANTLYSGAINFQGKDVRFDTVAFMAASPPKIIGATDGNDPFPTFENCIKRGASSDAMLVGLPQGGTATNARGARLEPERSTRFAVTQSGLQVFVPGSELPYVQDNGSSYNLTGTTLTWTAADGTKFQVGDFIRAECVTNDLAVTSFVPAFMVTSVVGTAITAEAIVDVDNITGTAHTTNTRIMVQEWAPAQQLRGDTNSNTSLTNVSPTTILKVGDWIKGTGIATNTRVTVVAGSTVTINKNATATATGVDLYWGRIHASPTVGAGL